MDSYAQGPSLDTRVTSLQAMAEEAWAMARAAERRAAEADARARDAVRLAGIVNGDPPPPPGRHAKPKRDRSHLRVIQGGLSGLAPAAVLLLHGSPGAAAMAAGRWVWRMSNDHFKYVVAAGLVAVAGAVGPVVSSMEPTPAHPLLVRVDQDHDAPPARVIPAMIAQGARYQRPGP